MISAVAWLSLGLWDSWKPRSSKSVWSTLTSRKWTTHMKQSRENKWKDEGGGERFILGKVGLAPFRENNRDGTWTRRGRRFLSHKYKSSKLNMLITGELCDDFSERQTDQCLYFRFKVEVWCLTRPARSVKPFVTQHLGIGETVRGHSNLLYSHVYTGGLQRSKTLRH